MGSVQSTATLEASSPTMTARVLVRPDAPDVEADVFDQTARVANEVGGGTAPGLTSDPGPRSNIAQDFKLAIRTEQWGNLVGVYPGADAGEKLLRDAGGRRLMSGDLTTEGNGPQYA
jgi:hypothetical protein